MSFAENLRNLRKRAGFSQEKLAEKLNVSRQAITKWESEAGTPDIGNIMAISTLFGISIDELLGMENPQAIHEDFIFESVTEYDIDRPKSYDMHLGGAMCVTISGYDGEKIILRLSSNKITSIQRDFKVKIDDVRDSIDIDVHRSKGLTEAEAKANLFISVLIPKKYIRDIELDVNAESIVLSGMECDEIEMNAKIHKLTLDGIVGTVEINCDLDMDILCRSLQGRIDVNQISATSTITLPENSSFRTVVKGIGNSVSYARGGKRCDDFSNAEAENTIELNGMKSELVITA